MNGQLTALFEGEEGQQRLYGYGVKLFRESRESVPHDREIRLEALFAKARGSGFGSESSRRARAEYEAELLGQLMSYSVPRCFAQKGAYEGVYDPVRAASAIFGREVDIDRETALEALSAAQIESSEVGGASPAPQGVDVLDLSTWPRDSRFVTAVLRPSGDVAAWCAAMAGVYRQELALLLLGEKRAPDLV